ncbi:hypothetical protein O6H91_Y042400 [Diphasiastrum complanatum]|nr:hypothetical protein O6H91_Y042400 [Diphasiastrum complanatum]
MMSYTFKVGTLAICCPLPSISCKEDNVKQVKENMFPYPEIHVNILRDTGERTLLHADILRQKHNNKFGLVLDIAREASEFQQTHRGDKRRPIWKAIGDRVNELAGETVTDAYLEDHPEWSMYFELEVQREKRGVNEVSGRNKLVVGNEGEDAVEENKMVFVRTYPSFKDPIYD